MIDPDFRPDETVEDMMERKISTDLRVVVIEPNGARRVEFVPRELNEQVRKMHDLVGGYLEAVRLIMSPPMIMWCNDDGHALGLMPNAFASLIAVAYTPVVLGTVVLSGDSDRNGDMTSLANHWIDQLVPGYFDSEEDSNA